jgi:WD40 repeat protein
MAHLAVSWPVVALTAVRRGAVEILAAGGFDGGLEVWTPDAAGTLRLTDRLSGDGYTHLARLVPCPGVGDRSVLVSLGTDGAARVWDLELLRDGGVPIGPGGGISAVGCARVRSRSVVVTGSKDGRIRSWDLRTGEEIGPELAGHDGEVTAIVCGRFAGMPIAVTSGRDAALRVWDLKVGRLLHTIAMPEPARELLLTMKGDIVAAMNWELVVCSPAGPETAVARPMPARLDG